MVSREDLDNFDDSIDRRRRSAPSQPQRGSAAPRRNPPQPHRSGSQPQQRRPRPNNGASGRPVYRNASARRRREAQRKRRLRNRAIILGIGAALLILIIVLFSLMIRGCSSGSGSKEKVSTDTIQQQGGVTATPDEAANTGTAEGDLSPTYFKTPVIKDDNTNGELCYSIYVWNKTGYELFGGDDVRSAGTPQVRRRCFDLSGGQHQGGLLRSGQERNPDQRLQLPRRPQRGVYLLQVRPPLDGSRRILRLQGVCRHQQDDAAQA